MNAEMPFDVEAEVDARSKQAVEVSPMRTKRAVGVVAGAVLLLVLAGLPAWAHHAFAAEFDANKPINFKATVTKMEWINPHSWIHVDVKMPDGTVQNWAIEVGTPNVLFKRGFSKNSLLAGTEIAIDGYQAKDGSHRANGRDITLPDGRTLFAGSPGTGGPDEPK